MRNITAMQRIKYALSTEPPLTKNFEKSDKTDMLKTEKQTASTKNNTNTDFLMYIIFRAIFMIILPLSVVRNGY